MKFGSREVANVVFRAKNKMTLGSRTFYKDEPVVYFDTLKTSGLEGASTTVYAQGGWNNPRLIGWDGDKTLTLTMEDALLSPESMAILMNATLNEGSATKKIYVHTTSQVEVKKANELVLPKDSDGKVVKLCWNKARNQATGSNTGYIEHAEADIFCMKVNEDGEIVSEPCIPFSVSYQDNVCTIKCHADGIPGDNPTKTNALAQGDIVLVDYYVEKESGWEIEIAADKFAGNFYIEGETLFRRESDGMDLPAEFIIPNGKLQSNFNFAMSNSGDPSTFTFTVDCFPAYPKFLRTGEERKKVLALMQIINEDSSKEATREPCTVAEG